MIESAPLLAEQQDSLSNDLSPQDNVLSFPLGQTRCAPRSFGRHEVFGFIFEALLDQRLMPGDALSLRWISEHYGVGRRVAEQVLNQLAKTGLTQRKPGCTAQVWVIDRQLLSEVLHARQVLELSAVTLLCQANANIDTRGLDTLIAREKRFLDTRQHAKALHCATQFHLKLVTETGNELLVRFAQSLVARSYLGCAQHGSDWLNEHHRQREQLMSALAKQDRASASHCIHLITTLHDTHNFV